MTTMQLPSISLEELPEKLKRQVQHYLKHQRPASVDGAEPRFALHGATWIAFDGNGSRAFGATPVTAVRRLYKA